MAGEVVFALPCALVAPLGAQTVESLAAGVSVVLGLVNGVVTEDWKTEPKRESGPSRILSGITPRPGESEYSSAAAGPTEVNPSPCKARC